MPREPSARDSSLPSARAPVFHLFYSAELYGPTGGPRSFETFPSHDLQRAFSSPHLICFWAPQSLTQSMEHTSLTACHVLMWAKQQTAFLTLGSICTEHKQAKDYSRGCHCKLVRRPGSAHGGYLRSRLRLLSVGMHLRMSDSQHVGNGSVCWLCEGRDSAACVICAPAAASFESRSFCLPARAEIAS